MRVLVIGSGAREHALLLALRADPKVEALAVAPGNAGTAALADQHRVDITSADDVVALARDIRADLVVIGPEVPLVLGVADAVRDAGIACFGPSRAASQIEGSKAFAKDVMAAAGVRTASSEIVDNPACLDAALDRPATKGKPPLIVLNPGAQYGAAKLWKSEYFSELADRFIQDLGATVLLSSAPRERKIVDNIRQRMKHSAVDLSTAGVTLGSLKEIVRRCDLMVTNDTGPRHIAACHYAAKDAAAA